MVTSDFNIKERGNGGELSLVNGDLLLGNALYNQVYLCLFGGNIEANTDNNYLINEDRLDYWGNDLFFKDSPDVQFNSNTERVLKNVVINSAGRYAIINAVNEDLQYLKKVVNFTVDVLINTTNRITIVVVFTPKQQQESKTLQLVYDQAKNEIIINENF